MVGHGDSLVICGSWTSLGVQCTDKGTAHPPSPNNADPQDQWPLLLLPLASGGDGGQDRVTAGPPCAGQELLLKSVADRVPLLADGLVVGSCGFWQG